MVTIRPTFLLLLAGLLYLDAAAQQDQSFRINSVNGDSTGLYRSVYSYPNFTRGQVLLKDQKMASGLFNYNRLSGQILFINGRGDTLEFASPESIRYVAILKDTFYYFDKSFGQSVSHFKGVNLYKKETIQYNGKEKKGAYGGYSNTTAANSIDKVSDQNDLKKIDVDENTLYVSSTHYYLAGHNGNFLSAVNKNFRKLFPQKEKQLNAYLVKNKMNYKDERDLLKLIEYLQND
jgi:hypothetical protein